MFQVCDIYDLDKSCNNKAEAEDKVEAEDFNS